MGKIEQTDGRKKERRISKSTLVIARVIFVSAGLLLGFGVVALVNNYVTDWEFLKEYLIVCQAVTALFFAAVFFLTAPAILILLNKISGFVEDLLKPYSGKEIFMGIVGLLVGIAISIALKYVLSSIISSEVVVYIITAVVLVMLGFVGMRIGARMMSDIWIPASNIEKASAIKAETDVKILDSSALIDGRVLDIVRTGFLSGTVIIPDFILTELSKIADNDDPLKKNRGRRGLDIAAELQKERGIEVTIDYSVKEEAPTDTKILALADSKRAKIITIDYNLNKLAAAKNIEALNINELSNAIKPIALPGEKMPLKIVKGGKEQGQGVSYAPDGTMIVVENGGPYIGQTVEVTVTTSLQTSAGRIIFCRIMD
ncbi:MAG: hypothetical protein FWE62_00660 [Firmicutes bacterium]|nr:hypothetical protein [Bacillota bacterium]